MANIIDVLKYIIGIDNADLKRGAKEADQVVGNMSKSIKGALLGVAGAFGVAFGVHQIKRMVDSVGNFALGVTMTAARTEVLSTVMEQVGRVAGYSAKYLHDLEEQIKDVGITTQVARTILIRLMQAELSLADAVNIARAAQDLAVIADMNTADAAAQLTDAIAMQRPILLKQFGILTDLNDIYSKQAKLVGKGVDQLTEYERRQAFVNEILDQAKRVAGAYESAMQKAGKQMTSVPRYAEEAANAIGNIFLPMFSQMVQDVTKGFKKIDEGVNKDKAELERWQGRMLVLYGQVRAEFGLMKEFIDRVIDSVRFLKIGIIELPLTILERMGLLEKSVKRFKVTLEEGFVGPLPKPGGAEEKAVETLSDAVIKERVWLYSRLIDLDEKYRFDYIDSLKTMLQDDRLSAEQRLEVRKLLIDQYMQLRQLDLDHAKRIKQDELDFLEQSDAEIAAGMEAMRERTGAILDERAEKIRRTVEEELRFTSQIYGAIGDVAGNAFRTIILSHESATKKMKAILEDFLGAIVNVLARWIAQEITNSLMRIATHKATETAMTAITAQEEAKRAAIRAAAATAGPFAWLGIPFLHAGGLAKFQRGGLVGGDGASYDSILAALQPGEFVMPRRAVERIGMPMLEQMRKTGTAAGSVTINIDMSGFTFTGKKADATLVAATIRDRVAEAVDEAVKARKLVI